jgi:hypothetical protein
MRKKIETIKESDSVQESAKENERKECKFIIGSR